MYYKGSSKGSIEFRALGFRGFTVPLKGSMRVPLKGSTRATVRVLYRGPHSGSWALGLYCTTIDYD